MLQYIFYQDIYIEYCAAGKEEVLIRRVPHYYKEFHCIAGDCKDNCCVGGWEIDIDDEMAEYYMNLQGEFGDRLRASITRTDEYCFQLKDGKCPFLDNKNLCEIYQELGEDKMGVVCTQFPRYTEYYGAVKETGIGLACEEAERIIFSDKEYFSLISEEIDEAETPDSEYDKELAEKLFRVRDRLFTLMEEPSFTLHEKLIILLNIAYEIQEAVNRNRYDEMNSFFDMPIEKMAPEYINKAYVKQEPQKAVERILYPYEELEVLSADWQEQMNMLFDSLHSDAVATEEYEAIGKAFMKDIKGRLYEYENLVKYFLFRYFMKAAYDHDIFGKAQMITANYLVIRDMDMLKWLKQNKTFTFADRIDTVHIFSREVEYSQDNVIALAEEFLFDDIFQLENLCGLLQNL